MSRYCGDCACLDLSNTKDKKFYCYKNKSYVWANSKEAENCRNFYGRTYSTKEQARGEIDKAFKAQGEPLPHCYITTIVTNILGMSDDEEVLNTIRAFRDDYLQKDIKYKDLLLKYDVLGSMLALKINLLPNKKDIALDLYNIYLKGVAKYIKQNRYEEAIYLYSEMTSCLINQFIMFYEIPDKVKENYCISLGGHGYLKK